MTWSQHRKALASRMGRRGQYLLVIGVGWVLYGFSMLIEPLRPLPPGVFLVHYLLPVWVRAGIWILGGAIAIAYGVGRPRRDRWGFAALIVPPLAWSLFLLTSWAALFITGEGDRRGWASAIVWASTAVGVHLVSGWAEPRVRAHLAALKGTGTQGRE